MRTRALVTRLAALVLLAPLAAVAQSPGWPSGSHGLERGWRQVGPGPRRWPGAGAVRDTIATDADGFRLALAPYAYRFPHDHAAHPEYRSEWWYYTGHLAGGGRRFGYELTFFRVGLPRLRGASPSAWAVHDLVFAHVALTDETRDAYLSHDAVARPALGMAGADTARYAVWLDASSAALAPDGRTHELVGDAPDFGFALALDPAKAPAIHGEGGVSRKGAARGATSHYYSFTRMASRGRVRVGGDSLAVTGTSWMDHEFGSASLAGTHSGWDWFSLQLDDGRELMLYRLRLADGGTEPFSSGTLVARDGGTRHLALADFAIDSTGAWTSPRTHARYPSGWRVRVPSAGLDLALAPTVRAQEFVAPHMDGIAYWEGSVTVRGSAGGRPVAGRGYVELTGYTGKPPM